MGVTTARRQAVGAAAAVVALVLSACGGGAQGGDVATAGGDANPAAEDAEDTAPLDEEAQALAFAACMRDNGVDMPDPAPGQEGLVRALQHEDVQDTDRATRDQALAACEEFLPTYEHEAGHDAEREDAMLELAECLREQGLDVPDDLRGLHDVDDDELVEAMEECRDEAGGVREGGRG